MIRKTDNLYPHCISTSYKQLLQKQKSRCKEVGRFMMLVAAWQLASYIYIYINKEERVHKGWPKAYKKYTIGAWRQKQKRRRITKNLTRPHLEPNQSTKLIKGKDLSSINNLVQDQKLQTKEFFNLWINSSSLLKAILFLSF